MDKVWCPKRVWVMRMNENGFVKRVFESVRGRLLVKWINTVDEYCIERGDREGIKWAARGCWNRESWRSLCGHPLQESYCKGTGHRRYK